MSQHPQPKPLGTGIMPPPHLLQGLFMRSTIAHRQEYRLSALALVVLLNMGVMEYCGLRITAKSFRKFILSMSDRKVLYYFQGLLDRALVSTYLDTGVVCYVITDLGQVLLNDINDDYELFTRKLFGT